MRNFLKNILNAATDAVWAVCVGNSIQEQEFRIARQKMEAYKASKK